MWICQRLVFPDQLDRKSAVPRLPPLHGRAGQSRPRGRRHNLAPSVTGYRETTHQIPCASPPVPGLRAGSVPPVLRGASSDASKSRSSWESSSTWQPLGRGPHMDTEHNIETGPFRKVILPFARVVRRVELPHKRVEFFTLASGCDRRDSYGPGTSPAEWGPKRRSPRSGWISRSEFPDRVERQLRLGIQMCGAISLVML